jgi:hypothetical protein
MQNDSIFCMHEIYMKNLTIRGIDPELDRALRSKSKNKKESINQTVLKILKNAFGLSKPVIFKTYDDLDDLAGTWSEEDESYFNEQIKEMRKIDRDLWA